MKYCKNCVSPDTRPGISIDLDGICSGCYGQSLKEEKINWKERKKQFVTICKNAKTISNNYDCIIPASGGKDSWYQIIKCKEYGLRPLAFTYRTPGRNFIGQQNIDLMLKNLDVDHIDFTVSINLEKEFMKKSFEEKGDPGLPFHMAVYVMPYKFAKLMNIPLIIWGENPQLEFGGVEDKQLETDINDSWMKNFGCVHNTDANYWISEGFDRNAMGAFNINQFQNQFASFKVKRIFLGAFFKWNSFENAKLAKSYGFKSGSEYKKTGFWNFADLDCNFISLHHFPMFYKFGTFRSLDNISVQIRYGLITRKKAINKIEKEGLNIPIEDIKTFCNFVGTDIEWFWLNLEKFRNKTIWEKINGVWKIPNFILNNFNWDNLNQYARS